MSYQQKPNRGSLFANDRKSKPTDPDYKGSAVIEGVGEVWLSGWKQQSKSGQAYLAISVSPKQKQSHAGGNGYGQAQQYQAPQRQAPAQQGGFTSDEIPFS